MHVSFKLVRLVLDFTINMVYDKELSRDIELLKERIEDIQYGEGSDMLYEDIKTVASFLEQTKHLNMTSMQHSQALQTVSSFKRLFPLTIRAMSTI